MRSNVARKHQEAKWAASPTARAYRIEEQIGYLLRRAHQSASAIFQVTVGDPNITPTQYSSMVKLNEYTELSQNLLGRLVGMDKATMQGVVRRLKERRLVDSRPDPGDARRTLLSLTTEGQRLVNKLLVNGPAVSKTPWPPWPGRTWCWPAAPTSTRRGSAGRSTRTCSTSAESPSCAAFRPTLPAGAWAPPRAGASFWRPICRRCSTA